MSKHALNLARDQQRKIGTSAAEDTCTGIFSRTMGVLCSHMIQTRQLSSEALEVSDFDKQWWLGEVTSLMPSLSISQNPVAQRLSDLVDAVVAMPVHRQVAILSEMERSTSSFTQVQNPPVARARGRPQKSVARIGSSSRRDPSSFEIDPSTGKKLRTCSICHAVGHNRRTCPRRQTGV